VNTSFGPPPAVAGVLRFWGRLQCPSWPRDGSALEASRAQGRLVLHPKGEASKPWAIETPARVAGSDARRAGGSTARASDRLAAHPRTRRRRAQSSEHATGRGIQHRHELPARPMAAPQLPPAVHRQLGRHGAVVGDLLVARSTSFRPRGGVSRFRGGGCMSRSIGWSHPFGSSDRVARDSGLLLMAPVLPNSGSDPGDAVPSRRRLPPTERPLSEKLIADLHARREWLAEVQSVAGHRVFEYLRLDWYDGDAREWATADIAADAALLWHELGLRPPEAAELQREGFVPEEVSALWRGSGIPVEEIADWIGAGLTPQEALAQRAGGITVEDAAVMRRLRNLGAG